MFLRLIASQPRSPERWHTRGGLVAVLGHAALVTGALLGTLRPTDPPTAIPAVLMPWPQPSEQPRGGVPAAPLLGDPVVVPVDVPPGLPLIEGPRPFDSTQWLRGSRDGFDAPALDYVRRAVFRPGRVHGRPVRVLVRLPVDFRLTAGR